MILPGDFFISQEHYKVIIHDIMQEKILLAGFSACGGSLLRHKKRDTCLPCISSVFSVPDTGIFCLLSKFDPIKQIKSSAPQFS